MDNEPIMNRSLPNEIRSYVLSLAHKLRLSINGGLDIIAENIAFVLNLCEPLEDVDGLHEAYLFISYLVYVQKDLRIALQAVELALTKYDDEYLRKIQKTLQMALAEERKTK